MNARAALLLLFLGSPVFADRLLPSAHLEDSDLREASGLAASGLRDDLLWAVNDSGGKPALYAVGTDGAARGLVTIRGARNRDWEDLAAFRLGGVPYLLIADTGDNRASHKTSFLHIVREPASTTNSSAEIAWSIPFRLEGGPCDIEAVGVDIAAQKVLLLSKRATPPILFELPLRPAGRSTIQARRLGPVATIPPSSILEQMIDPYGPQPTGMSIAPDGSSLALLTYRAAYLYRREPGEDWLAALSREPRRLPIPRLFQAECIAFSRDAKTVYVTSEGPNAPLLRLDLSRER